MTIAGIFNRVFAPQTPLRHPTLYVVIHVSASDPSDAGTDHLARVELRDPDGRVIWAPEAVPVRTQPMDDALRPSAWVIFEVRDLVIPRFGDYELHATLAERKAVLVDLMVCPLVAPDNPDAVA